MTTGTVAFLWGIAFFLATYAILTYRAAQDPRTTPIPTDADWDAPTVSRGNTLNPDSVLEKYVRPALRNMIPLTPTAARVKGDRRARIDDLLWSSGNPWNLTINEYVALQVLLAMVVPIPFALLAAALALPVIPAVAVGAVIGAFTPRYFYRRQRSIRVTDADRSLPEAMDLLQITMASGQQFTSALNEVSRRMPPGVLASELRLVVEDLATGKPLDRSLAELARRLPTESVESFTRAITQAERLGTDMSETLNQQSRFVRAAYENRVDKMIGSLGSLIFLPILIGLVPACFIIIGAPALSSLGDFL